MIPLDARNHRTYHYWHVFVPGLHAGPALRVPGDGRSTRSADCASIRKRCCSTRMARAVVVPRRYDRGAAAAPGDNAAVAMRSVVVDPDAYDWEGDAPLRRPFSRTVIYEMHVAGFTRHPSSGVAPARRGTYAGLIEKIPYLQDLGVTAVELLPVFQFDAQDCPPGLVNTGATRRSRSLRPTPATARGRDPLAPVDEFRDMVKALHRAGIEVILDVVYNHTAEGDHERPDALASAASTTRRTTSSRPNRRATRTTPAPATRSTPTTPSCGA